MRFLSTIPFLFWTFIGYSQPGKINGQLTNGLNFSAKTPVMIYLIRDTVLLAETTAAKDGKFSFEKIAAGTYKLLFQQLHCRSKMTTGIFVLSGKQAALNINYPDINSTDTFFRDHQVCLINAADIIIPIVYGLPTAVNAKKEREGKIHMAGCMTMGYHPQYYCPVHKKEF